MFATDLHDTGETEHAYYTVFQKKRHPFYFYDNFIRCRPI